MRFLFRELSRSLVTHWKYNFLLLFELALCVLVVFVLLFNVKTSAESADWYKTTISDAVRYQLNLVEDPSVSSAEIIAAEGGNIISAIKSNTSWKFYSWCETGFGIPFQADGSFSLPAKFESGYEDGVHLESNDELGVQAVKCAYFTPEVFQAYGMTISEGRMFSEKDYTYEEGQPYQVILGSEYKEFYKIGDIIDGSLYTQEDKLEVIGFLNSGSFIASPGVNYLLSLDRYIIFPYFTKEILKDGSVMKDPLGGITGAFMAEGTLLITDPTVDVQYEINKITNTYGFPAIQCVQYTGSTIESAEVISQRNVTLLSALAAVICGLSILSIGMILKRRTQREMLTYGMYMISGILPRKIYMAILLELMLFAGLAILPAVWLSYYQYHSMVVPPWQLLFISIPILLISTLPVRKLISRVNLDQIIRRKSQ